LEAIPAGRLPEKRFEIVAIYDNARSIYLLGGMNATNIGTTQILKYDIYTEAVELVGHFPEALNQGTAHLDKEGNIFYFGGEYGTPSKKSDIVWKISPNSVGTTLSSPVGKLPHGIAGHCSVYDGYNTFLVQGGYSTTFQEQLYSYDKIRNTAFAFTLANPTPRTSSACALVNGSTFVMFGGWENTFENTAVKYDLATGLKTVVDNTFEFGVTGSVAVETKDLVYVVGGGNGDPEQLKHHLSTFDPTTDELQPLVIIGMRTNLYRPGVAYVPAQRRIYVFGGREYGTPSGTETVDEIFYIAV